MGDRTKLGGIGALKVNPRRCSMANPPTSSRTKIVPKAGASRPKKTLDSTILKQEQSVPDVDVDLDQQIAYGRFMRDMLEEILIEEKIEKEETCIEILMTQLAERFRTTMYQLDKTNRRLKDISFVVEQKRLIDLKNNDTTQFCNMTDNSNAKKLLQDLSTSEQQCLDTIELRNVDFGYDKTSGHQQLLHAVNDAIEGLGKIKKESSLDPQIFKEYDNSKQGIEEIDKNRFELQSLKSALEAEFPRISERLLQEASERIARMIENDDDEESHDGDD